MRLHVLLCGLSLLAAPGPGLSAPAEDEVVLFSFFRGNGEAGVYLAWSEDGLKFTPLNGDKPVMAPAPWPGQNLTRDPSIVYRDGKFRMVWTSSWTGRVFGYAESPDLQQWSTPRMVTPFPASLPEEDQPANVWAPEIQWDPAQRNYMVMWSSTTERERKDADGSSNSERNNARHDHRVYISRTTDGEKFSEAKLFLDQGFSVIDAYMAYDESGTAAAGDDRWIMIIKHEQEVSRGGKNLRMLTAPAALSEPWSPASPPIFGPGSSVRPREMVEGPSLLRWRGEWLLYTDAFANGHYSMASSADLKNWTDRTAELQVPRGARHGTFFRAPKSAVAFPGADKR